MAAAHRECRRERGVGQWEAGSGEDAARRPGKEGGCGGANGVGDGKVGKALEPGAGRKDG